jgi:hypothetical protein
MKYLVGLIAVATLTLSFPAESMASNGGLEFAPFQARRIASQNIRQNVRRSRAQSVGVQCVGDRCAQTVRVAPLTVQSRQVIVVPQQFVAPQSTIIRSQTLIYR